MPSRSTIAKFSPLFLAAFLFIAFEILTASPWPDDRDGVNFLLGVKSYDIEFHQPHFPGYPAYIAAGKAMALFTGSAEWGLILLSVFSGVVCLFITFLVAEEEFDRRTAYIIAAALAVNPVFFEFSHKIFSEIPALLLGLLAILALGGSGKISTGRWFLAGISVGLMLGVRLSWWPFALFYVAIALFTAKRAFAVTGFLFGVLLWLLPQAAFVGPEQLLSIGKSFTSGHFNEWGGAVGTTFANGNRPALIAMRIAEVFGWAGTGTMWTRIPWALFMVFGFFTFFYSGHEKSGRIKFFGAAAALYFVWVIFGQNPEKVRHFIPFVPLSLLIVGYAIRKYPKGATVILLIYALTLPIDYSLRESDTPPTVRLKRWVDSTSNSYTLFFCGESERFFDLHPAKARFVNVTGTTNLELAVKSTWPEPDASFICDDIPGFIPAGKPVALFLARKGDPVDRSLKVYESTF
ncbi:MAG: glycosyltransferase family 39 protein [Candidatus Desulfatibia sp.]|uniref:glycosyltransferase family 39 protein n=1 Tax=Candidatus Desulfatibia sp. TaxID=3101189 RepID=UPI002F325E24